jgi:AraC-like DNA-binding protein
VFEQADIIETLLRGAGAGVLVLLALVLAFGAQREKTRTLAALFAVSSAFYTLVSGEAVSAVVGFALRPLVIIPIYGTVFFWWFAAALFDDTFKWRWWRFAPLVVLPALHFAHEWTPHADWERLFWFMHIGLNAAMFADAFRLAIVNAADDLVDPRRRFRVAVAATVGVFGIAIAIAETAARNVILPDALRMLHAVAIFVMSIGFGAWFLAPNMRLFFGRETAEPQSAPGAWVQPGPAVEAADRAAYDRLVELMDRGVYREDGLTVASLAEKVGVPEHRLRKLINGALGFRNFSAFLNTRRIADAKAALSDPAQARRQVLQIALDLGYGSIAPFNRAFKTETGMTPTEFRKKALGEA